MRILLVSDIHANWAALQAVDEKFDLCFCLGDLVDYGVEPAPCIDWVRQRARFVVRGNHDHGAVHDVRVNAQSGYKYLTQMTRPITRERLGTEDLRYLASLPVSQMATIDDIRFLMVHATPRDPLDEFAPADVEFWQRRLQAVDADVICVGHTHNPYVLEVGDKMVINPGSLGLPRDGNPRPSYAILDDGAVELKRFDYPIDDAIAAVQESPLPDQAKELLIQSYRRGTLNSL